MQQINYPSEWLLGKPGGSIKDLPNRGYRATITVGNNKLRELFLFKF